MKLVPDAVFGDLRDITPEFLAENGVKALILDIDYTLAPKGEPLPDEGAAAFVAAMRRGGVALSIISNNHYDRVSLFAGALGLPFICDSFKPFTWAFRRAARDMGARPEETAAVGDQIYTDVLGAHLAGMKACLILRENVRRPFLYRLRHLFERPFIHIYFRNRGGRAK